MFLCKWFSNLTSNLRLTNIRLTIITFTNLRLPDCSNYPILYPVHLANHSLVFTTKMEVPFIHEVLLLYCPVPRYLVRRKCKYKLRNSSYDVLLEKVCNNNTSLITWPEICGSQQFASRVPKLRKVNTMGTTVGIKSGKGGEKKESIFAILPCRKTCF